MKVICYGDSNTYGYDPRSYWGGRYKENWVDLLAKKTGWSIFNLGENGQKIPKGCAFFPVDTDLLIIMLGTNDLLESLSAEDASEKMDRFLMGVNLEQEKILLIAPPPMRIGEWVQNQELVDASISLAKNYQALAQRLKIRFCNAGDWNVSMSFDGVHFTEEGHRNFAEGLANVLTFSSCKQQE